MLRDLVEITQCGDLTTLDSKEVYRVVDSEEATRYVEVLGCDRLETLGRPKKLAKLRGLTLTWAVLLRDISGLIDLPNLTHLRLYRAKSLANYEPLGTA